MNNYHDILSLICISTLNSPTKLKIFKVVSYSSVTLQSLGFSIIIYKLSHHFSSKCSLRSLSLTLVFASVTLSLMPCKQEMKKNATHSQGKVNAHLFHTFQEPKHLQNTHARTHKHTHKLSRIRTFVSLGTLAYRGKRVKTGHSFKNFSNIECVFLLCFSARRPWL